MNSIRLFISGFFAFSMAINGMELDFMPDLNLSCEEGICEEFDFFVNEDDHNPTRIKQIINDTIALTQTGVDFRSIVNKDGDSLLHRLSCTHVHPVDVHTYASLLIAGGCPVDIKNQQGQTPLHCAVNVGNKPLCALLIKKDPALLNEIDGKGKIPLHIAVENKSLTMVDWLMDNGSEDYVLMKDNQGQSSIDILLSCTNNNRLDAAGGISSWNLDRELCESLTRSMTEGDLVTMREMVDNAKSAVGLKQRKVMNSALAIPINKQLKRLRNSGGASPESESKRPRQKK